MNLLGCSSSRVAAQLAMPNMSCGFCTNWIINVRMSHLC